METNVVLFSIDYNQYLTLSYELTKDYSKARMFSSILEGEDFLEKNARKIKEGTASNFWTTRKFYMI